MFSPYIAEISLNIKPRIIKSFEVVHSISG